MECVNVNSGRKSRKKMNLVVLSSQICSMDYSESKLK